MRIALLLLSLTACATPSPSPGALELLEGLEDRVFPFYGLTKSALVSSAPFGPELVERPKCADLDPVDENLLVTIEVEPISVVRRAAISANAEAFEEITKRAAKLTACTKTFPIAPPEEFNCHLGVLWSFHRKGSFTPGSCADLTSYLRVAEVHQIVAYRLRNVPPPQDFSRRDARVFVERMEALSKQPAAASAWALEQLRKKARAAGDERFLQAADEVEKRAAPAPGR
ncbi:MAG: hypothetical protein AAGN66_30100 [Acidobacteriota bacterium]